jgi:hypothetical protein
VLERKRKNNKKLNSQTGADKDWEGKERNRETDKEREKKKKG